jgi:acyl carrier protein
MTREEFLLGLDEILELPAGTLTGPENLENLGQWDSAAMIGFVALADTHNGIRIHPRLIANCSTVEDLLKLAKADGGSK